MAGGRVAVIAVSGVGDEKLGNGRDAVVAALVQDPDRAWTADAPREIRLVATADSGDSTESVLGTGPGAPNLREPFPVPVTRVSPTQGSTAPSADVFEMHWADLSKASGWRKVPYLVFAIALQLTLLAPEALKHLSSRRAGILRTSLFGMSYSLAYGVCLAVVAQLALAATGVVLLIVPDDRTGMLWGVLIAGTVVAAALGWLAASRVYRGGWTFDPPGDPTGLSEEAGSQDATSVATGLGIGLSTGVGLFALGLAIVDAGRPLATQIAYVAGCVAVAATACVLAFGLVGGQFARRVRVNAVGACGAAVVAGPFAWAIVAAARADGRPEYGVANALHDVSMGALRVVWLVVLVLAAIAVLVPLGAGVDAIRRKNTVVLAVVAGPLLFALAANALLAAFAAGAKWMAQSDRLNAISWPATGPAEMSLRCPDRALTAALGSPCGISSSTADLSVAPDVRPEPGPLGWAESIALAVAQPLGVALIGLIVLLAVVGCSLLPYVRSFRQRSAFASTWEVSGSQGRAFSTGVARIGAYFASNPPGSPWAWVSRAAPLAVAASAVLFWIDPTRLAANGDGVVAQAGEWLAGAAFKVGLFGGGLLLLAIGVGVASSDVAKRALPGIAKGIDIVYDIATYLRVGNPALVVPRTRMIARYRALLQHLATANDGDPYRDIVVVAHSQGSALSLATFLGDDDRIPAVPFAPPPVTDGGRVVLLSYGCPAWQSYGRRFPGQFSEWDPGASAFTLRGLDRWVNVYRAGDYVGRSVIPDADDYDGVPLHEGAFQERCIGPGHHTGYPGDERWRRIVRGLVRNPEVSIDDIDLADLVVDSVDDE